MKSTFLLTLALLIACEAKTPPPPAPPVQASTDPRQADLAYLARELPARHPDIFHHLPREAWERELAEIELALPELSDAQLAVRIARLVASLRDGHTEMAIYAIPSFKRLPILLYPFPEGLYITQISEEHADFRGHRVTHIGDLEVSDARAAIEPLIAHDNPHNLLANLPTYLNIPEVLAAVGASEDASTARFTMEDGRVLELAPLDSLKAVRWVKPSEPLPHYRRKAGMHYWNDYIAEHRTLYFKYNVCADAPSGMSFAELVEGTLGFMQQKPVDRFVLDLRDNGGGNSALAAPLIQALAAHPTLNAPGKLYVIIGRTTFSSALFNTLEMRKATQALLVGEPTGGKPNHFGEVQQMILPHTGWQVRYSTKRFTLETQGDPETVTPDLPVQVSAMDYFAGRDPVLEAALNHAPDLP